MWSTLGKVTPLSETHTFSHFPPRMPTDCTYSVMFQKRQRAWGRSWCSRKTNLHKSAKVNAGLVVKWQLFRTRCKERWLFLVALSECFLSWLLTTGMDKGWLWEGRSAPSVSDVFMPGWGNWMAAECSHAGPSHPNQRLPFFCCFFFVFEEAGPERRTYIIWLKRLVGVRKRMRKHPIHFLAPSLFSVHCYAEVNHKMWI